MKIIHRIESTIQSGLSEKRNPFLNINVGLIEFLHILLSVFLQADEISKYQLGAYICVYVRLVP